MITDTAADAAIRTRIARLVGAPIGGLTPVTAGGYSDAGRWIVRWAGGSAFAKLGTGSWSAEGVRNEHVAYSEVALECMPAVIAFDDGGGGDTPLLLIEDLSDAHWSPPWSGIAVDTLVHMLATVAAAPIPDRMRAAEAWQPGSDQWQHVGEDPRDVLDAKACTGAWLDMALPTLIEAAAQFDPAGNALLHGDLFPQNWCVADRGPVIVDWSSARIGDAEADQVHLLLGVRVSCNGDAGVFTPDVRDLVSPESVAWFAGRLAQWAGEHRDEKPARFRETQRRELWHGLCWAAERLELPPPVVPAGAPPIGDYRP